MLINSSKQITNTSIHRSFQSVLAENARLFWCLIFALVLSFAMPAIAQIQTAEPDLPPPELAQRLKKLESELRCLVCQNQTLAESPAGLAGDLRREVRLLIDQGKTDDEIKAYLKARYGDFVLYRPPVDHKTYLLWFGPFFLLGGGGLLMWWMARRRTIRAAQPIASSATVGGDDATRRARNLLNDTPESK